MQVGPLPLGPGSFMQQTYADGEIPYVKRPPNDLPEAIALVREAIALVELKQATGSLMTLPCNT